MGRVLAIDYGLKRVGLAVTDPERIIASGLETLPPGEVISFLTGYTAKEKVDAIVVGDPKTLRNTASEAKKYIQPFVRSLKKAFPDITVELFDERFTSGMAQDTLLAAGAGRKKRRDKALVDRISAALILQSYLEYKKAVKEK